MIDTCTTDRTAHLATELGLSLQTRWLIPKNLEHPEHWPTIACDQYTSDVHYWNQWYQAIGDDPSTAHLIFPEVYLESISDHSEYISKIHTTMTHYLSNGLFKSYENGVMLTKRHTSTGIRYGIVTCIDLEAYDYRDGTTPLIRASEATVTDRIPPRLAIRQNAPLEATHTLLVYEDPSNQSTMDFVTQVLNDVQIECVFESNLAFEAGHVASYFVPLDHPALYDFLCALRTSLKKSDDGFSFAVGDGNHSLATAKAHWESLKHTPSIDLTNHPARFASVELISIDDPSLPFEPIHQIVFDLDIDSFEQAAHTFYQDHLMIQTVDQATWEAQRTSYDEPYELERKISIPAMSGNTYKIWQLTVPKETLALTKLRQFLDMYLTQHALRTDYVHDHQTVTTCAKEPSTYGFCLPKLKRDILFKEMMLHGRMPRKTFSLGHAQDKRFYLETREIL